MAESRMKELADELLERSKAQKVDWEETRATSAYRVIFPDVSIRISQHGVGFGDDAEEYELELTSETGRVIGSLSPAQEEPVLTVLAEIYKLAEQYVRDIGVNKALDYLKRA